MKVLIIIPTYNERENIATIVPRVRASVPEAHILVADDNSPDGTSDEARAIAQEDGRVRVIQRIGRRGLSLLFRQCGTLFIEKLRQALDIQQTLPFR